MGEIVPFFSLHRFVLPVCFINPTHVPVPGILSVFPSSYSPPRLLPVLQCLWQGQVPLPWAVSSGKSPAGQTRLGRSLGQTPAERE